MQRKMYHDVLTSSTELRTSVTTLLKDVVEENKNSSDNTAILMKNAEALLQVQVYQDLIVSQPYQLLFDLQASLADIHPFSSRVKESFSCFWGGELSYYSNQNYSAARNLHALRQAIKEISSPTISTNDLEAWRKRYALAIGLLLTWHEKHKDSSDPSLKKLDEAIAGILKKNYIAREDKLAWLSESKSDNNADMGYVEFYQKQTESPDILKKWKASETARQQEEADLKEARETYERNLAAFEKALALLTADQALENSLFASIRVNGKNLLVVETIKRGKKLAETLKRDINALISYEAANGILTEATLMLEKFKKIFHIEPNYQPQPDLGTAVITHAKNLAALADSRIKDKNGYELAWKISAFASAILFALCLASFIAATIISCGGTAIIGGGLYAAMILGLSGGVATKLTADAFFSTARKNPTKDQVEQLASCAMTALTTK